MDNCTRPFSSANVNWLTFMSGALPPQLLVTVFIFTVMEVDLVWVNGLLLTNGDHANPVIKTIRRVRRERFMGVALSVSDWIFLSRSIFPQRSEKIGWPRSLWILCHSYKDKAS